MLKNIPKASQKLRPKHVEALINKHKCCVGINVKCVQVNDRLNYDTE